MSKNCIVDEFIAVDENGQLTIWSVDELTVDDLTVDELTVDELTCYRASIDLPFGAVLLPFITLEAPGMQLGHL